MVIIQNVPPDPDEHWRIAQGTSGKYFLISGLLMTLIGYGLKITEHTNFLLLKCWS